MCILVDWIIKQLHKHYKRHGCADVCMILELVLWWVHTFFHKIIIWYKIILPGRFLQHVQPQPCPQALSYVEKGLVSTVCTCARLFVKLSI